MANKINVLLHTNNIQHNGKYEEYSYNELRLNETSGKRLYFSAIKNGMKMITIIKNMQFMDGKVYVSFGKVKYEIGSYEEVSI
ncbi:MULTISPECIES: hypothetical protein [Lysinibacillus]|uniref:hypothetical protein n=1 Tax=Lysinibacillus TaxID=400634 RepID=UPI00214BE3A6|nr:MULTISPECIES: hypothetical protein [Lysinibacillus]UUV25891.1 hypothetical protein NP781_04545 [Lysinibacillus sp. FN11]UYB48764.1 hypothetical protein OCI51_07335 [Lysinibacillus capsici]